ncbi:MAG: phosphoribosylformylglycinamidine synthase subunit PurL [Candidatus Omnitrophota bacterium]
MIWRIDVFSKKRQPCPKLFAQIRDLGRFKDFKVCFRKTYFIDSDLSREQIGDIASQLLIDPVIENYFLTQGFFKEKPDSCQILITHNPGVSDIAAMSLEKAIKDLSLIIKSAKTAKFYEFEGLSREDIEYLAPKVLFNPLIEHILEYEKVKNSNTLDEFAGKAYKFNLVKIDILNSSENELINISNQGCLSLSLDEMKIIQGYFQDLGRGPTDCELETIATLWSEHCGHKTFRGIIEYEEKDSEGNLIKKEVINNLLKSTIMKATKEINSLECVSVFDDNSGIVRFDKDYNICFKVETHNHPSSLEPYGGASTGIGGVIRDILGTGCSAKPFASIDVFCFSPWDISYDSLPQGLLHPKRVIKGVVEGVRDYGNKMGIPTVAGAVLFDRRFLGNPLVYCGTLGILHRDKSFKKSKPGDLVILAGAKTGRDGIHGATFSSKELDEQTVGLTSAVQIGNPIEEKKLTEAILRARDKNLFNSITDCGAGGISSAITELAREHGVKVNLDKIPLKYKGLTYTEIWISESQERMVFFTQKEKLPELKEIFDEEDAGLTVVGEVTADNKLKLFYQDNKVCELNMDFIFHLPKLKKKAVWIDKKEDDFKLKEKNAYNDELKNILSSPNIACKDWVLREYDHEVQAASVIKSIYGIENTGVNDAAVIRPDLASDKCAAVAIGINPFYSDIDPYHMACLAIDEALRNILCAGAKLNKTFILDNFSWGSPLNEEVLGGLVRASKACYDFSTYFGVPFISGKDSLYNEYMVGDKHISIPGTLLISAVAIIDDWRKVVTANFKKAGSLIYIIGFTKPELGASEYFRNLKIKTGIVPKVDRKMAKPVFEALSRAMDKELVSCCHDLSEGGLGLGIAEMCISSDLGANIFLGEVPQSEQMLNYELLFSESPSRFIVEVDKERKADFEKELKQVPLGLIGCVSKEKRLVINDSEGKEIINLEIEALRKPWMDTFKEFR